MVLVFIGKTLVLIVSAMHVEYSTTHLRSFAVDVIAEGVLLVDVVGILVDNDKEGVDTCVCACVLLRADVFCALNTCYACQRITLVDVVVAVDFAARSAPCASGDAPRACPCSNAGKRVVVWCSLAFMQRGVATCVLKAMPGCPSQSLERGFTGKFVFILVCSIVTRFRCIVAGKVVDEAFSGNFLVVQRVV